MHRSGGTAAPRRERTAFAPRSRRPRARAGTSFQFSRSPPITLTGQREGTPVRRASHRSTNTTTTDSDHDISCPADVARHALGLRVSPSAPAAAEAGDRPIRLGHAMVPGLARADGRIRVGGLSSGRRVRRALPFRPAGERRARRAARRHVRADVARQFETLCLHRDLARRGTRRADVSSLPDVAGARPMAEPPQAPRHSRAAVHARLPRGQAARLRGAGARRRGRGLCVGRSDRCDRAARGADRAPQRRLLLSAVRRSAAARDRQPVVSSFAPALGRRGRNTPSARTGRRGRRRHRRMARRARRTARRRIGDRRRGRAACADRMYSCRTTSTTSRSRLR